MKKETLEGKLQPHEERLLEESLHRKYASYLGMRSFHCSSTHDAKSCQVELLLENPDKSFHYPVQGRMDYKEQGLSLRDAQLFLLDYLEQYFESFFLEEEEVFLPIHWESYKLEDYTLYLRGQIHNLLQEKAADKILAEKKL